MSDAGMMAGSSILGNILNVGSQLYLNNKNLEYQKQRDEKMIALQHEVFGREDNAVQRRAADLTAAGMSPLLAAGASAQASGPVSLQGQHIDKAPQIDINGIMSALLQGSMIQKTRSDIENQKLQTDAIVASKMAQAHRDTTAANLDTAKHLYEYGSDEKNPDLKKMYPYYQKRQYNDLVNRRLLHDLLKSQDWQLRSTDPIWGPMQREMYKHESRLKKKEADFYYWGKGVDFLKGVLGYGVAGKLMKAAKSSKK